jgi:hypothetical protein
MALRYSKIKLHIAETLLFGFGFANPSMMYTNETGYVVACDGVTSEST